VLVSVCIGTGNNRVQHGFEASTNFYVEFDIETFSFLVQGEARGTNRLAALVCCKVFFLITALITHQQKNKFIISNRDTMANANNGGVGEEGVLYSPGGAEKKEQSRTLPRRTGTENVLAVWMAG